MENKTKSQILTEISKPEYGEFSAVEIVILLNAHITSVTIDYTVPATKTVEKPVGKKPWFRKQKTEKAVISTVKEMSVVSSHNWTLVGALTGGKVTAVRVRDIEELVK